MNFNKKISKKSFFVTGTDTGVGKTLFCSILMNKFHYNYWKPIQTGNKNDNDTIYIKKICKIPTVSSVSSWIFFFPIVTARLAGFNRAPLHSGQF